MRECPDDAGEDVVVLERSTSPRSGVPEKRTKQCSTRLAARESYTLTRKKERLETGAGEQRGGSVCVREKDLLWCGSQSQAVSVRTDEDDNFVQRTNCASCR